MSKSPTFAEGSEEAALCIKINTSATSNMVWTQMQLQRWNGTSWDQFGEVLDAASA